MTGQEFVDSLKAECEQVLGKLAVTTTAGAGQLSPDQLTALLQAALKNEMVNWCQ